MTKILNCLKKRDLLHNPQAGGSELSQYGQEYLRQDRPVDALDCFEKAGDMEGVRQVREISITEGQPFLLQQTSKLLGEKIASEVWEKVGEKALSEGRLYQALTAFKAAQNENKTREIENRMESQVEDANQ
jgi:hypothetical protein